MALGGRRPGAGRKKGVPNKFTADVRAAIVEAFTKAGGADYLAKLAVKNPAVFCALLGKVVPSEVVSTVTVRYAVRVPMPAATSDEWQQQHTPLSNPTIQ